MQHIHMSPVSLYFRVTSAPNQSWTRVQF